MITFYHNFESVLISLRFQELGHFLCKTMSTEQLGPGWKWKVCWQDLDFKKMLSEKVAPQGNFLKIYSIKLNLKG